jgi:thiol-disulfide isomerase/thioredoxin
MRARQFLTLALSGVLVGALAGGVWKWQQREHPVEADQNGPSTQLPDFSLPGMDNSPWRSEEWRNKILVINFWATWCPPCVSEMPLLDRLAKTYADRDVVFVGIAVDDKDAVKHFVRDHHIGFPILLGETHAMNLMKRLGNRFNALPFTVVADHGGSIILRQFGTVSEKDLQSLLDKVTLGH